MKNLLFLFALAILISCSSSAGSDTENSTDATPVKITAVSGEAGQANIHISGMSCEKMCVSKIKKTLADLEGVEDMEIDFDADRTVDVFKVQYDESKLSEKEMIDAVHGIAGGVYKVTEVEVNTATDVTSYNYIPTVRKKRKVFSSKKVEERSFKMPNIFDALKKFGGIR